MRRVSGFSLLWLVFAVCAPPAARAGDAPPVDSIVLAQPTGDARWLGLGGAVVGLGDDVNALAVNPGAMPRLPRTLDTAGALGKDWAGFLGTVSQPYKSLAAGAILWGQPLPAGPVRLGGPGLAAAWRPLRWISAGGNWQLTRAAGDGAGQLGGQDWTSQFTFGLFVRPTGRDAPGVGLTYRPQADWTLQDPGGRPLRIASPAVWSAGVAWHMDIMGATRLLFTGQSDLIQNSRVGLQPDAVQPDDAFDYRFATEVWIPLPGCYSGCGNMLQVRAAVINRAASVSGSGGCGENPASGRSWCWAGGASLALHRLLSGKLRLDGAYSSEGNAWRLGFAWRYPEAFRAELHHRRVPRGQR